MRTYKTSINHLTTLFRASTDSLNQSQLLETALSFCTIFILLTLALLQYEPLLAKARKTEIYAMFTKIQSDAVVNYAVTGTWALSDDINEDLSRYNRSAHHSIQTVEMKRGNISITYEMNKAKIFTDEYRLAYVDELKPTLYWKCGYASAREDEIIKSENATNAPKLSLTHLCR